MMLKTFEESIVIEGKEFKIGQRVFANSCSMYSGLCGIIFKILTGEDKDTDNSTTDVYVELEDGDESIMSADMLETRVIANWEDDETIKAKRRWENE